MGLKISQKIAVGSALFTALVVTAGGAGFWATVSLGAMLDYVTTSAWDAADGAMEGVIEIHKQVIVVQRAQGAAADQAKVRAELDQADRAARAALGRSLNSGVLAEEDRRTLETRYQRFRDATEGLLSAAGTARQRPADGTAQQALVQANGDFERAMGDLLGFLDAFEEKADGALESKIGEVASIQTRARSVIFATVTFGVLLAIVAYLISRRTIVNPIRRVARSLTDIGQGAGDLTVRLDASGSDELAEVAQGFNLFVQKTQGTIGEIMAATGTLGAASEQLAGVLTGARDSAQRQSSATEQVATAMNQMSATVQEVARNTGVAADSATAADQQAQAGQQVVEQAGLTIQALADDIAAAALAIGALENDANRIGSVIDVIKSVAEQTNLLALNAAIEAARAGEQGRGFAVVADEVRTLANRTQQSTAEIQNIIATLQTSAKNAVGVMESSRQRADASVARAQEAGSTLDAISRSVASINDMNTHIAAATSQQSQVAEEINRRLLDINHAASEISNGVEQSAQSSEQLAELAVSLQRTAGRFRI